MFVIIGHVLQGTLYDNVCRYIIYSFHMPLFIGISGYLFNYSKCGFASLKEIILKYLFRVIVPWVVAVLVYIPLVNLVNLPSEDLLKLTFDSFIKPYYHLWFIPGFLSWILVTWIAGKVRVSVEKLLVLSCVISIASLVLKEYPALYFKIPVLGKVIDLVLYTFRPFFYVFFVFGIYLRSKPLLSYLRLDVGMALVGAIGTLLLFYYPSKIASIPLFFLFNLVLLRVSIKISRKGLLPRSGWIEWVGVNSLGFYLWHVVPIIVVRLFVGTEDLTRFYVVLCICELIFAGALVQMTRIKLINKYLFGMG